MKKFEYFEKLLFKGIAERKINATTNSSRLSEHTLKDDYIRLDTFFNLFHETKHKTAKHFRTEDSYFHGICDCGNNMSKNKMFCSNCNAKILATCGKNK